MFVHNILTIAVLFKKGDVLVTL